MDKDKLLTSSHLTQKPIEYNKWGITGSLKVGDELTFDSWLHVMEWLTFKTTKPPKVNWINGSANG